MVDGDRKEGGYCRPSVRLPFQSCRARRNVRRSLYHPASTIYHHSPPRMAVPSLMPLISRLATRAYYRFTVGGMRVPAEGPVLLVANHNNSLMDPALVTVAAQREVRFLAKSTLFTHKQIGWLVKLVGSIPVYRA